MHLLSLVKIIILHGAVKAQNEALTSLIIAGWDSHHSEKFTRKTASWACQLNHDFDAKK